MISFDSSLFHWKRELVQANRRNVESAKSFAQNIRDRGGQFFAVHRPKQHNRPIYSLLSIAATDINSAVLEGARMLNANPREGSASILILLTDGDPTTGYDQAHAMHEQQSVPSACITCGGSDCWVDANPAVRLLSPQGRQTRREYSQT